MAAQDAFHIPMLAQQLGKALTVDTLVGVDIGDATVDRGLMHQQNCRTVRILGQSASEPVESLAIDVPVMPIGHCHVETNYPDRPPIPGVEMQRTRGSDIV